MTFKYLKCQYISAPILHLDTRTHGTTTRGHQLKLEKGRSRLDVRKHFFTQRVVNLWNALPVNLVSAPTVNAFKNRLDKNSLLIFLGNWLPKQITEIVKLGGSVFCISARSAPPPPRPRLSECFGF